MGKIINSLDAVLQHRQEQVEELNPGSLIGKLALKNYYANNHKPKRPTKKKKKRH